MGSFNKIGFISSLPIMCGDETALIFMSKQQDERDAIVCSSDWFKTYFTGIFGRYDDYGRIDCIQNTKMVSYIEDFFGTDIMTIITEVDDISVGRDRKISATKNTDIYEKLTFGLEHKYVYDHMSGIKRIGYESDYITGWWLSKLSFKRESDNPDKRYKQTWRHTSIPNYEIRSDGRWSSLYDINGKQHSNSIYTPKDLEREMVILSNGSYVSSLTDEDKSKCSIDICIENTKLGKNSPGHDKLREWTSSMCIDGKDNLEYSLTDKGIFSILDRVDEREIGDFCRFNRCVSRLNANYKPSNYGSQEQDLRFYYDMLKCYKEVIKNKIRSDIDNGYDDNFTLTEFLADIKTEDRDEKLHDVLDNQ